jgi:minor histocompatibility antigen H13
MEVGASAAPSDTKDDSQKYTPPKRPDGLQKGILSLYVALGATVTFFVVVGESMKQPVPEGKFKLKSGELIDINAFDPVELGPFPKCHPHAKEHKQVATGTWVKNDDVPSGGPFPVGHPENPEWVAKSDADAKRETKETRFTWKGLQPSLHLLSVACLCVLIGCKHAVWILTEKNEDGKRGDGGQSLQSGDAMWFPVFGSFALFGMFIIYKYIGSDWIKTAITCFIVTMCMFGFGTNVEQFWSLVRDAKAKPFFIVPFFEHPLTVMGCVGYVVGASMGVGFIMSKNWILNNLFGLSFCIMGIKMIGISSYKTGAIMLIGLFFYDIFWVFGSKPVFGSNVMVTVAKGVEAPIKLMFPRSMGGCGQLEHSMLGLGDIVVPGLFIAFLAKFDAVVMEEGKAKSYVYLNVTMVAYALSLVTTVGIMLFFNAAQPALLYIVPYVLIASLAVALARGEVKKLWGYYIPDEEEAAGAKAGADETKKTT